MAEVNDWLVHDHSEFESLLGNCAEAVDVDDWDEAEASLAALKAQITLHMTMEDDILYPAYLEVSGLPVEPVHALQSEHRTIARLLVELEPVFKSRDSDHVRQSLVPLEQALTRHHDKEEDIFLPMAGHMLLEKKDELLRRLNEFRE